MTEWRAFPFRLIDRDDPLFRIHRHDRSPIWFNSDGTGRFDPPADNRRCFGVCYFGFEAVSAYIEVFGRIGTLSQIDIDQRRLTELSSTRRLTVADLTDRSVLGGFGVTAEYSTGGDYELAQDLALNLFEARFDGVVYRIRHDPAMALEAVALFGEPGEDTSRFGPSKTVPIPDALIESGEREFGIYVVASALLP